MGKVGIIPAAGKSQRFGGIPKEMLPLPDGRCLLQHAIERVKDCDEVIIITSPAKYALHLQILGNRHRLVFQTKPGLWGAIEAGMNAVDGDQYFMTMPDTWIKPTCFKGIPFVDFGYGYFITNTPERYGVLKDGMFIDKPKNINCPMLAWGVLVWSKAIRDLWSANNVPDYTSAINRTIWSTPYSHWAIGPYFDCANVDRYMELLDYLRKQNA